MSGYIAATWRYEWLNGWMKL